MNSLVRTLTFKQSSASSRATNLPEIQAVGRSVGSYEPSRGCICNVSNVSAVLLTEPTLSALLQLKSRVGQSGN